MLGRVYTLESQDRGDDEPHGPIVLCSLIAARGESAELFQAIDQALDAIARAVEVSIKGIPSVFIAAARLSSPKSAWDGNPSAMLAQVLANLATAVAFITDQAPRSQLQPSTARTLHDTLCHEGLECRRLMSMTWGQSDCHQLAVTFSADVDLGAEAALAAA